MRNSILLLDNYNYFRNANERKVAEKPYGIIVNRIELNGYSTNWLLVHIST